MGPGEVVQRVFDAVARGLWDEVWEPFSPGVVVHVSGDNQVSGEHVGLESWIAAVERQRALTEGTFKPSLHALTAEDDGTHAVALIEIGATVEGRSVSWRRIIAYHVEGDAIARMWVHDTDTELADKAFGPPVARARSADGTTVAALRTGQGPPVLLIHGTTGSAFSWRFVAPLLATDRTVYAMQRRGRGLSGDGPEYSLDREAEDVVALIDAIGGQVDVVGHSFGANCAMEALLRTTNIRKTVLYEPAIGWTNEPGYLDGLRKYLDAGDNEGALLAVLQASGLNEAEIAALRESPTWSERVALVHTTPREEEASEAYTLDGARFASLTTPILFIIGELSPYAAGVEHAREALRGATVVTLEGQGHAALATAPELFVEEVRRFL